MIHFKIGDKVKVIDDNLSGTVTKVNENEITIETDFVIPFPVPGFYNNRLFGAVNIFYTKIVLLFSQFLL
ncbi:hypothetical protein [Ornithobacterium rhinotracheale]|uniref:hypothetical protein n=1 Tax=Ornithobacterium rhinotracheale TaxID=28251 RepID=UPI0038732E8C